MNANKFSSKQKLTNYLRYSLNKESIETPIKDGDLFNVLIGVLDFHPNKEEKIGAGIDCFYITNCDINYRNNKFKILRTDETSVDFSFSKAVKNFKRVLCY